MSSTPLSPALRELEGEAIYCMRETAAQFSRPAILFSGGKDSILLVHLARRAFAPAPIPFPLLHIDTGHNFEETLKFRNQLVAELNLKLHVARVQDSIDAGLVTEETGPNRSRNALQTVTLVNAIRDLRLDACIGGGRRDEEKARAKERFFSHRNLAGEWDPKDQRPEVWNLYNGRQRQGEHFRVFPLSNWTELDVWNYIRARQISVPDLYFSHERLVVARHGGLLAHSEFLGEIEGEVPHVRRVRFRTIGDATCTGATESIASNIDEVIAEIAATRTSERSTRADDQRSDSAMEDRKARGYF